MKSTRITHMHALPLAVLTLSAFLSAAHADIWKASARGARQDAHYLINSETGAVALMKNARCVRSFSGTIIKSPSGAASKVQVDAELGGGNGPRGNQRTVFTLQEGKSDIVVESSFRGNRPPLPADYLITCRGKACVLPACE